MLIFTSKKWLINKFIFDNTGGMSILYLAFTILVIIGMVIFPMMIDCGLYAARLMQFKSAMRSAINAAVQEIDHEESLVGLSTGFDESTGMLQTSEISFKEDLCKKVFGQMFMSSTGISEDRIKDYLTLVFVQPKSSGIEYIITRGGTRITGNVLLPNEIEAVVNSQLNFGEIDNKYLIYVEGNKSTNGLEKRPYLMAVIKDYEIDGLLSKRNYTFISFKAARINRRIYN